MNYIFAFAQTCPNSNFTKAMVNHRSYTKCHNNKYMKEYNEKAPSKYIMYLDANNLYRWALSQCLPTINFKWMTDKEISKIDLR